MFKKKKKTNTDEKLTPRYDSALRHELIRDRGAEIADWTYGSVWTRVYRNRRRSTGEVYYRYIQNRLYVRPDCTIGLSKSFRVQDFEDCSRGLARARQFLLAQLKKDEGR